MADISRSEVAGLIPQAYSNAFLENIIAASAVLSSFTTVRIGTKVNTFPVVSALPSAGFVTEDVSTSAGTKPTSDMQWANKVITAEEIAVIIPIHENVIADASVDLWAQIRPRVAEAFGAIIDDAVLFGTGKPASWRAGLVPAAIAAGAVSTLSSTVDIADAFNGAFGHVESQGYDVSTIYAGPAMRSRLRGLRATDGQFIYADLRNGVGQEIVFGSPMQVVKNGIWDDTDALALVADRSKLVAAIREDITYKVLDQATVGGINLAEKDMVALRVKMRCGWEVASNATRLAGSPVPFAVVAAAASS